MTEPVLQIRNATKSFGPTRALRGVSLDIFPGRVLALIGENGAGKSTLMKILSGAHRADSGSMRLAGQPFRADSPHRARLAGVAMIYQELNLAPDLSVEDNMMLGQEIHRAGWLARKTQRRRVAEVLELLGHPELSPRAIVGRLSIGAQQVVEIARALVVKAKVVVFDEPTSSLPRRDVDRLFEVMRKLKAQGLGIVYISHFLEEIREVCDDYAILCDGVSTGAGTLNAISDEQIITKMVGRSVDDLFPTVSHEPGETILEMSELSGEKLPQDVTLTLRRGEILGVAGLVGAGRTELLRLLYGLDAVARGEVRLAGQVIARANRRRNTAALGLVSEDRKGEGLAQEMSIADNLTLNRLTPYSTAGLLDLRRRNRVTAEWMQRLQVKARSPRQAIENLSGGNQQKVAIARILHQDADVLLLDEPTRGVDVRTKAEIYRLIGELAAAGKAILFVSSYLPELMAVCDRIAVMSRGRLRAVRPTSEWTEEAVLNCAIGSDLPSTPPARNDG